MSEIRTTIHHLVQEALDAASAKKPVVVQLAWYVTDYKVLSIVNTTLLKPGEWLSVGAVDQLNATANWEVRIADNDVINTLLGFAGGLVVGGSKL